MAVNKKRRQRMKWKSALLAVLVLGVVLSFVEPSVFAASKKEGEKSSEKQATLFDPFAMQSVALASGDGTAVVPAELKLTRRTIRIPFRPGLRSAFRPVW